MEGALRVQGLYTCIRAASGSLPGELAPGAQLLMTTPGPGACTWLSTTFDHTHHAESSFGAASYLIVRPDGNVLVDFPRWAPPLVQRLQSMGPIKYMYLTHRDDVADRRKYRQHFGWIASCTKTKFLPGLAMSKLS